MEKKLTLAALAFSLGLIGFTLLKSNDTSLQTANQNRMLKTISALDFAKDTKENRNIIDVRTHEEYTAGHIARSQNIDFMSPDFAEEISKLDKEAPYAIYCRSGNRSGQALRTMESLGFTDVLDLQGGIVAWNGAGETLCTEC